MGKSKKSEPDGVIYYIQGYAKYSTDEEIKIVSALSNYDLKKDNSINNVLTKLVSNGIINEDRKNRWLTKDYFREFVKIVQSNYIMITIMRSIRWFLKKKCRMGSCPIKNWPYWKRYIINLRILDRQIFLIIHIRKKAMWKPEWERLFLILM